jgi:hypothetical protein
MGTPENHDHVRPVLRQVEADLARHLEEACEDHDRENIADESTDELLRLEEELLAAARAVDQAVRLRRKLGDDKRDAGKEAGAPEPAAADAPGIRLREFRTASGSEWRVWEVRPGAAGRVTRPGLYPVDYAQGWLTFELLDGERRKRLPGFAAEWNASSDADLERLLDQAVEVTKRKPAATEQLGPDVGT